MLNLLVGQGRVAEDIVIGHIDQLEDGVAIVGHELLAVGILDGRQVVALGYQVRDAYHLLGNILRDGNQHLDPVGVLDKSQSLHVLGVIGIVVDAAACAHTVIALDEHALGIHVGKTQGTGQVLHALALAPTGHGIDQGINHLGIVDKVDVTEARLFLIAALVHHMIDDAGNAAHDLAVAVGQIIHRLTEVKCGVLVRPQGV